MKDDLHDHNVVTASQHGRSFSNMQWYLSHAGNTVHLVAVVDRIVQQSEFTEMVRSCLQSYPDLGLSEDRLKEKFHLPRSGAQPSLEMQDGQCVLNYQVDKGLHDDPSRFMHPAGHVFDNPDLPAFRANCWVSDVDQEDAGKSVIRISASHSLVEGADLATVVRGQTNRRGKRTEDPGKLSPLVRLGLGLAAPLLAMVHVTLAKRESRKPADFSFSCVELDRADVARVAAEYGISKRTLLFALSLFALSRPKKEGSAIRYAYSKLPKRRIRMEDDSFLSVRMQFMAFKATGGFADFAGRLDRELNRQNETEVLTQFLANRVLRVQRWIRRFAPALYRGPFFGYAPYDIVLSLVPPLKPSGQYDALAQARLFGGSYTGTVPNVIYLWGPRSVTMTCWLEQRHSDRLGKLAAVCDDLGIALTIWPQSQRLS